MNISKNQIWVVIAIIAIGVIALVSDVEIKIEVGTEDYATKQECILREAQACPSDACAGAIVGYCKNLDYPD